MPDEKLLQNQSQREAWLASFPDKNPNPILEISLDGHIGYTNPAIRQLFPTLEKQGTDHPYFARWSEIVDQFRRQPELVIARDVKVGGDDYQQSIFYVEEFQRLRVYGTNITARKHLEADIQESERKYRELIKCAPVGIYEVDFRTQKFTSVNDAMCLLTGYSREELLSMTAMEILDDPSKQLFKQRIQSWLSGQTPEKNVEFRALAKDGHEIFAELEVTFTNDDMGRPLGATVIGHDVTERKHAEEKLRQSQVAITAERDRLRALIDNMSDEIYLCDQTGKIVLANQAALQGLGLNSIEELLVPAEQITEEMEIYNLEGVRRRPEDAPIFKSIRGEKIRDEEIIRNRRTGELRFREFIAAPICSASGEIQGGLSVVRDITERKEAEQALQESEARYRTLIETSPDAVFVHRDNRFLFANETTLELFGAESFEQLSTHKILDLIAPSDRESIQERIQSTLAGNRVARREVNILRIDGTEIHVDAGTVLINYQGQPALQVVLRDITERMEAQKLDKTLNRIHQVIHSHLRFDHIMQRALAEAAIALESDSAAISMRRRGKWFPTYFYGFPHDVRGIEMNDDEERHAVLAIRTKQPVAVEDAFNDERFNREHLRKWGIRSVLVIPILLKSKTIGVIFFNYQRATYHFRERHIDFAKQLAASISLALENARLIENLQAELNERKRVEASLRESEQIIETFFAHSPSILNIDDEDFRYLKTDAYTPIYFGLDRQSIIGKSVKDLAPEFAEEFGPMMKQVIETGEPILNKEVRSPLSGRNGEMAYWQASYFPVPLPGGKRGLGVVGVEITERKALERQLQEMNELLEQHVHERTKELQTANMDLEKSLEAEKSLQKQLIQAEKYAALARLLASVAHEINNPLQTVLNSLYLLEPEIQSTESAQVLEMAISESRRIGSLVQQLRETYQPSAQQRKEFNVMDVLNKVFALLGPQLKQSNIQWQISCAQDDIGLWGVPDQIQQVCLNICLNAIDVMHQTGGQLTVNVSKPEMEKVCISFQDTGPGIAPEDQLHIFEPLFTTKTKGLGLGLAISHQLIKSHGGDIVFDSQPGCGTTFIVTLPVASKDEITSSKVLP